MWDYFIDGGTTLLMDDHKGGPEIVWDEQIAWYWWWLNHRSLVHHKVSQSLVNTGAGNGLLPDSTKALPEQCWLIREAINH